MEAQKKGVFIQSILVMAFGALSGFIPFLFGFGLLSWQFWVAIALFNLCLVLFLKANTKRY